MHLFFHHLSSSWCNDESKHKHVNESLWVCEAAEWSHQEEQSGVSGEGAALSVIEAVSRDTGVKIVIIILSVRSHSFMDCRKQQGALVSLYNNIYKVEAKRVQPSLLWFLLQCKSMRILFSLPGTSDCSEHRWFSWIPSSIERAEMSWNVMVHTYVLCCDWIVAHETVFF